VIVAQASIWLAALFGGAQRGGRDAAGRNSRLNGSLVSGAVLLVVLACVARVSAASAAENDTITIGAVVSMSGQRASLVEHMVRGYDLAVKRVNEAGGVRVGNSVYRLKLTYRDDEGLASSAARAAEQIARDGVDFVVGPQSSALVEPVAAVMERHRIPMVNAGGGSLSLYTQGRRYFFGITTTVDDYLDDAIVMLAEESVRRHQPTDSVRVALAFLDVEAGREMRDSVMEQIRRFRMQVVVDDTLPDPVRDMGPTLDRVRDQKADALLVFGYAQGADLTVRQMAEKQVYVPMVALTFCDGAQLEKLGRNADYVTCMSQWDPYAGYTDRWFGNAVGFAVEFELEYGYAPPYQAAQGAAAILVLADAIERAGSTDREAVRRALSRTNLQTFFGPVRFDDTGRNRVKPMIVQQLHGGRYKAVWPREAAAARFIFPMPRWEDR